MVSMDRVNDFAFKIATANGTGSASANGLIMQAIFRMGVPVTGKNVFPSNIQGLPTWYEIRVSKDGYTARTPDFDLMVALNAATYQKDVAEVRSGGWLLYDSSWPLDEKLQRPDVTYLGVPLAEMCNAAFKGVRERILMKNIAYAGALAALLEMDTDIIRALLKEKFGQEAGADGLEPEGGRPRLRLREGALRLPAADPAEAARRDEGLDPDRRQHRRGARLPLRRRDGRRLVSDHAGDLADGGVPRLLPEVPARPGDEEEPLRDPPGGGRARRHRHGDRRRLGRARARSRRPPGPGISLMNEFIGLAYYAEVPAVIFDVQRTGPSTGMPTRTQQGDLMMCAYASHGDTRHICLYPADPREAFEFAVKAFDLAERFQTPVFVLSDLDIGMNDWMVPKLTWDDSYRPDRGKVLSAEQLEQAKTFYRYLDVDGDGIPYRTLPGVHPEGRVLHARLGPQQVRRLHRGRRRVPGGARPHRPQDPARGACGAGAGRPDRGRARRWGW